MVMFPRLGYARVWQKLTAGLVGLVVPSPSEKALRDLRRRLGPAPLKAMFEVVAGPLGRPRTPGVCYRGLRTVGFDGCNSLRVPDTARNRWWLGRIRYRMGFAGYPTVRLMALVETGTRGLLGASLGSSTDRDEAGLARRLLPLLGPGMLVLLDRAFDATVFLTDLDATGAKLLVRSKSTRKPPVLSHLPDGSYLSDLEGLTVRIVDADLGIAGADGSRASERYRLITTLIDHQRHPALELVRLYHERWEVEIAYLALRHTILEGHVLRSGDRNGLEQEIWARQTCVWAFPSAYYTHRAAKCAERRSDDRRRHRDLEADRAQDSRTCRAREVRPGPGGLGQSTSPIQRPRIVLTGHRSPRCCDAQAGRGHGDGSS